MRQKSTVKKLVAYVCAIALVISSMTYFQAKNVNAAIPGEMTVIDNTQAAYIPAGCAWKFYFGGAGGAVGSGGFSGGATINDDMNLYIEQTSGTQWGIQAFTPEITGLTAKTKYQYSVTFTASKSGTLYIKDEISGNDLAAKAYVEGLNTVKGTFTAADSGKAQLLIEMSGVSSDTLFNFTDISTTTDFVEEATTAPTTDADGYYSTSSNVWTTTTPWKAFAGGTASMKYKAGTINSNTVGLKTIIETSTGNLDWSIQVQLADLSLFGPLTANNTVYTVSFAYTSTKAGKILFQVNGGEGNMNVDIEEGTHIATLSYTSKADHPSVFLDLSGLPSGTNFDFTATFAKGGEVITTAPVAPTTAGPVETTTGSTPVETTQVAPTTGAPVETTTSAQEKIDWSNVAYLGDGAQGGALTDKYKAVATGGAQAVNLQDRNGNAGIYLTFPAAVSTCSLPSGKFEAEGAGMWAYVSEFTAKESSFTVTDGNGIKYTVNVYYVDGTEEAPTTGAPIETTAPVVETTATPVETTAPTVETTARPVETTTQTPTVKPTTQAPTTAAPTVNVGKVTVKTAVKKKSAKKATFTLKKVKGAKGYQVWASTSRKFTKKTTVKATTNKVKVTLKKLKPNKKYYYKVRAYKVADSKKVYGKWSKIKAIKMK